jgi:hypothetical protein
VADGPSIPRQTSALSLSILAAGFPARSSPFSLMAYAPERSTTTTSRRIWDKRQIEGFPYHESDLDSERKVGRLRWTLRSQGGSRSCYVIAPKPTATRLPEPPARTPQRSHFEAPRSTGAASISLTREFITPEFRKLPEDSKLASQLPVMIAGNPKSCRTIAACAVVLVLLIVVSTAFIAMRKRTAPLKVVPLHPSTFILSAR